MLHITGCWYTDVKLAEWSAVAFHRGGLDFLNYNISSLSITFTDQKTNSVKRYNPYFSYLRLKLAIFPHMIENTVRRDSKFPHYDGPSAVNHEAISSAPSIAINNHSPKNP